MDFQVGQDGGIANFIGDIEQAARNSNGFVLEVGVATGTGSTIAIQNGLKDHPNPLHISVDQRNYMSVEPSTSWWNLIIGDSRELATLTSVVELAGFRRPGLIFIDTDHTYEQMMPELLIWSQIATPETVWLFHDITMFSCYNEGMCQAIKEFAATSGWVYDDWKTEPHGLGRMRWASTLT